MAIKRAAELAAGAAKRTRSSPRLNNNSDLTTVTPKKGKDINKGKGKQSAQADIDLDFEDEGDISSSDDDDEYDGTWILDHDIVLNDQYHQYEDGVSTSVNEIEDPCPELADEVSIYASTITN